MSLQETLVRLGKHAIVASHTNGTASGSWHPDIATLLCHLSAVNPESVVVELNAETPELGQLFIAATRSTGFVATVHSVPPPDPERFLRNDGWVSGRAVLLEDGDIVAIERLHSERAHVCAFVINPRTGDDSSTIMIAATAAASKFPAAVLFFKTGFRYATETLQTLAGDLRYSLSFFGAVAVMIREHGVHSSK